MFIGLHRVVYWNAVKEWNCADLCQDFGNLLDGFDLVLAESQPFSSQRPAGCHSALREKPHTVLAWGLVPASVVTAKPDR